MSGLLEVRNYVAVSPSAAPVVGQFDCNVVHVTRKNA